MTSTCNNCSCPVAQIRSRHAIIKEWKHNEKMPSGVRARHKTCDPHRCDRPEPLKQKIKTVVLMKVKKKV